MELLQNSKLFLYLPTDLDVSNFIYLQISKIGVR